MKLSVLRHFRLWIRFFLNSLTRELEFKANFISQLVVDLVYYLSLYLFYYVIFQFTDTIGEFNKETVIIFMIVTYMIDAVFEIFFSANIGEFNTMVVKGNLDFVLTKPVNSQFLVSFRYVGFNGIVSLSILTVLLFYLLDHYPHSDIQFINLALFGVSFIMGNIIWYCTDFIIHCLSFWFKNFSVSGWLSNNIRQFSRRPDTIYSGFLRKVLFSLVPMALVASIPVRFLIYGFSAGLNLLIMQALICLICFILTRYVWNRGIYNYESASS